MRRSWNRFRTLFPRARRLAAWRRRANEVFEAADYGAAERLYEDATKEFPEDLDLLVRYALCATNCGRAIDALPRWKAVVSLNPDCALGWIGIAASERALDELARAQASIEEALRRFPDDVTVVSEAARLAMTRSRYEEALQLWTRLLASGSPHPDWLFHRAATLVALNRIEEAVDALAILRDSKQDHAGVGLLTAQIRKHRALRHDDMPAPMRFLPPIPGATPTTPSDLVLRFESLGDNCEFGLVQRYCFAEPLGLFRFSFSHLGKLVSLIEQDFASYGDDGDLELLIDPKTLDYDCRSLHYESFRYHTDVNSREVAADALVARESKKVWYLKRRLKEDILSAAKIFVRKGEDFEDASQLLRALRLHGAATLLWMELADADHPPGSVEVVEDGLLRGRVERFASYGNAHDIDLPIWMDVLCSAVALVSGERLCLAPNVLLESGQNWAMTRKADAETVESPRFPGAKTQKIRLLEPTDRAGAIVAMRLMKTGIEPRSLITISLWILVPEAFEGSLINVFLESIPSTFVGSADLKKRGVWQQIFTTARLPKEVSPVSAGLRIYGHIGDSIYIASWHLQTGCIPDRLAEPIPNDADQTLCSLETSSMGTGTGA